MALKDDPRRPTAAPTAAAAVCRGARRAAAAGQRGKSAGVAPCNATCFSVVAAGLQQRQIRGRQSRWGRVVLWPPRRLGCGSWQLSLLCMHEMSRLARWLLVRLLGFHRVAHFYAVKWPAHAPTAMVSLPGGRPGPKAPLHPALAPKPVRHAMLLPFWVQRRQRRPHPDHGRGQRPDACRSRGASR